ncbi:MULTISPECIES: LemA family protein [unclassified Wenzhouxiangella]|uniref:LemA family protein n=1 Tax=unclassified Wenzhouxiangella TaxID=2613841 RepID=UPI000E3260D1|nr:MULTISPECIES: LemA family protein [unclassified Wenzhouxiangella]RFF27691.1 LemA family protein [Wenzhouxiangella sp. 15181]RFP69782.1 LemA family protein [Wenzhouxiangella sp. 15190]
MIEGILIAIVLVLLVWGVVIFNRLVRARNLVRNGFADIDVQLQRRHDLVPQLVETVKAYSGHEQHVLQEVTALRSRAQEAEGKKQAQAMAGAEVALAAGLGRLLLLAEDYPELKATENFQQLTDELVETEDLLSHARRFYNGAVRDLNTRIQQFPDLLIARLTGFEEATFFSAEIEARSAPRVAGLLGTRNKD